jgi:hypothetical protein
MLADRNGYDSLIIAVLDVASAFHQPRVFGRLLFIADAGSTFGFS